MAEKQDSVHFVFALYKVIKLRVLSQAGNVF